MRIQSAAGIALAAIFFAWNGPVLAQPATAPPDASTLIEQLAGSDADVQKRAADALAEFPAQANVAVPALVEALTAKDPQLRWRAARTLAAIGNGSSAAVAALQKSLQDDDASVRGWSAYALGQFGEAGRAAAADVAALLVDKDRDVRRAAIGALIAMRLSQETMAKYMRQAIEDSDMDPSVTVPALNALANSGDRGIAILIEELNNEKACYWACLALGSAGPKAKAAVPELAKMTSSDEPEIRMQAAIALGQIGPDAKLAVPQLIKELSDEQNSVRYAAAFALGQIAAKEAAPELGKQLDSKDSFLRMISAWALARVNPNDKPTVDRAVKMLVEALKDKNPRVRATAARGLHELKLPPETVVPVFTELLKDQDPVVRANVIDALSTLDGKIIPSLTRGLENNATQSIAVGVIHRLGPAAKTLVPALVEELNDPSADHRQEVEFALAAIGPDAKEAVPALVKALGDPDPKVRYTACYALGKIGPGANEAAAVLQNNAKNSDDKFLKIASLWALLRIRPHDQPLKVLAVPLLIKALNESDRDLVRIEVASALGEIGAPVAIPALPALGKVATEADSAEVRDAAAQAIKKIAPHR
ncbi:MAG: HEAT repeat domain-containing protein [Pirellulales bacterium]|nr:HEAT repeat domain-containing protein [Pirellulales bacterium]